MKTRYIWIMAMAVVALTGCQKERVNGNLELIAEGMNGNTKLAINGLQSYWVAGESVRINNNNYTISVNSEENGRAYVDSDDEVTAPYCGVYPAGIYSSNAGTNYVLDLPDSYTYATTTFAGNTVQNLASPMVAFAADGATSLYFKHVTAAIGVQVKNYHDYAITVDQITLSSNSYKLHGSVSVTLGANIEVNPQTTDNTAEKVVTMNFGGQSGATLTVPAGGMAIVQIPVLPVGDGNKFTVSIQVSKSSPAVTATLTRTQTTGGALGRANLGYAMYTIGGPFSVSSTKKVVFSKGNLQYNPHANTWKFAANQYEYIGAGNANISDDYDGWIDLFGWGTGNNPTNTSTTPGDYSSFNDWGTAAAGNIGSGWYTLNENEWDYLIKTSSTNPGVDCRVCRSFGLPEAQESTSARFTKAIVNGVKGVILFPDVYVHPSNVTISYSLTQLKYNATNILYSYFSVTSGWEEMELAGAVFLPASERRNGTEVEKPEVGFYWSKSTSGDNGYSFCFMASNMYSKTIKFASEYTLKSYGFAVRLVRNVE